MPSPRSLNSCDAGRALQPVATGRGGCDRVATMAASTISPHLICKLQACIVTLGFLLQAPESNGKYRNALQNKDGDDLAGFEEGDIADEEFLDVDNTLTTRPDNLSAMFLLIVEDTELKM